MTVIDAEGVRRAEEDAAARRLGDALGARRAIAGMPLDDREVALAALELRLAELLDEGADRDERRAVALRTFQVARAMDVPAEGAPAAEWLLRVGAYGVLADRSVDVQSLLKRAAHPRLPVDSPRWDERVWATIMDLWLRLLRKGSWAELDEVQRLVAKLRADQEVYEPAQLDEVAGKDGLRLGWELMASYHMAKAAELLGEFLTQGTAEGKHDVRAQLQMQFDGATRTAERAGSFARLSLLRLLERAAEVMVRNSIWTVTRAVNSRVTRFARHLTDPSRRTPLFEMLPPQRHALHEKGLLGSGRRAVVVCLPTSSGKTYIAQFRMLQALNQFDAEAGWVAYLCPTRALVNQVTRRLHADFSPLGVRVERVSPALEVDGLEAAMLEDADAERRFRVLVTTPEKLDLMIRGGWEAKVGRPLTLVVVDEAHGIASENRGTRLELLLATINRECRNAQFLLLTPFVPNAAELAAWLDEESFDTIDDFSVEWQPNDRVIALARPLPAPGRGNVRVVLEPKDASRVSLPLREPLELAAGRPLGMTLSKLQQSPGHVAAATAAALSTRGTVIVLAAKKSTAWSIAERVREAVGGAVPESDDRRHVERFLAEELGPAHPIIELLRGGVAVHHAGLSDDARAAIEWLTEQGAIRVLAATTTLAQGVNFPVSGVVFVSHKLYKGTPPRLQPMSPEEFWNIAGRAGRVGQSDLGVVALAAHDEARALELTSFLAERVSSLRSTLLSMVEDAMRVGRTLPDLHQLSHVPAWSAFLQYLVHSYRGVGDHARFVTQVEQVLRGTLGFRELRRANRAVSDLLVTRVRAYAERIRANDRALPLVDATGFSLETVGHTFRRIADANIDASLWTPALFGPDPRPLARVMGVLMQIPELRPSLGDVAGGAMPGGEKLALIVRDWVGGRSLAEMAEAHFVADRGDDDDGDVREPEAARAMTRCCSLVFGKLASAASWGISALQALTMGDRWEQLPEDQIRMVRNLPARVYYGVNDDGAIALRLLGVPRAAAAPLAAALRVEAREPLHVLRERLRAADARTWQAAMRSDVGESFHRVWSVIEGGR